jgi:hypothetical protein
MTKDEILGRRRRADGIGLDEAEPRDRPRERRRSEQRTPNGVTTKAIEDHGNGELRMLTAEFIQQSAFGIQHSPFSIAS